ncbi:unnamed protein product, partial [Mesorhabditis spiculigera]
MLFVVFLCLKRLTKIPPYYNWLFAKRQILPQCCTIASLGQKAGITTLCIAGATLSDVLCITGFSITLGMIFGSERSNLSILLHVPVEMGLGMLFGLLGGLAINYMTKPSLKSNSVIETLLGVLLLLLGSLASLLGSDKADSHVLGPIAVLSLGFFTGYFTKKHRPELYSSMKFHLDLLWKFIFMPLLFGLIGFRLDPGMLFGGSSVELMRMCLILLVAMLCRVGTTYLSVCGPFNVKEKIFLAFAWLPKATIQAALATTFLDMAVLKKRGELVETGEGILLAAVLSIFLSAPVGQFFIQRFAGKLLQRDQEVIVQEQTELLESGGKVE